VIVGLSGVWAEEASERTEDLPNRKKTGPS
jgi:hypothetical protein